MAGGEKFDRRQRKAFEGVIFGLYRPRQADGNVNIPAFQHGKLGGADRLGQLDLHVRAALGVSVQECGKDTVKHLWCCRDLQDAGVGFPKELSSVAERPHCAKDGAGISKRLTGSLSAGLATISGRPRRQKNETELVTLENVSWRY
jgi:hypothetical protein